jgi:hypothetical protein
MGASPAPHSTPPLPAVRAALLISAVAASRCVAGDLPLWGKLPRGAYAVGFHSLWQLDFTRTYNMAFKDHTCYARGKAPRPILINVWYPAQAQEPSQRSPPGYASARRHMATSPVPDDARRGRCWRRKWPSRGWRDHTTG